MKLTLRPNFTRFTQLARGFWIVGVLLIGCPGLAEAQKTMGGLEPKPLAQIQDRHVSQLGQVALSIRPGDWLHSETENFVYHYFSSHIATPVSVEAEFYYRIITKELEKENEKWERKGHVFIFERDEDWRAFQQVGGLDPWTGGIHARNELFVRRNPEHRFKGNTLGHEVAHLVVDRFYGSGVPLWLNEGYAEYSSMRGYASFMRARGYMARPRSIPVSPAHFIPLEELTNILNYPQELTKVEAFYNQSEKLVRFLSAANKRSFLEFFKICSAGGRFETALRQAFGQRFLTMAALEREFREYASKDYSGPED